MSELINSTGFKAWLADDSFSPATDFIKSSTGYIRMDGVWIADDWDDLVDDELSASINTDENGEEINDGAFSSVCSNVAVNGRLAGDMYFYKQCGQWTTNSDSETGWVADQNSTGVEWIEGVYQWNCSASARLYCFEQ